MENETRAVIDLFNNAFQTHDPSDLVNIISDDCILENTGPVPDGAIYKGEEALNFWTGVVKDTSMSWEVEKVEVMGERALIFWRLSWGTEEPDSVRGVNIMHVKDGKIVEGKGYVKG